MTKTTKKVPAPRLRFPGFVGEWEEKKLGEVAKVVMGSSPSSTAYNDIGNGLPLIQGNADVKNRLTIKRFYTTEITREGEEGDIILSVRAPVGTVAITKFKVCLGRGVASLRSNSNQDFLYQILLSKEDSWKGVAQGGTFEAVTGQEVKSFPIPLPPTLPEQTRIAAALSSLDAVIAAHQSRQDALREHKRGLMAGLFPAEGERVPRLRFPEFEGAGEWEEKKLGEVATFLNGRAYSKDELLAEGKYKVLRVGNFFSNNHWYYSDLELEEAKYCDPGDLLYAWSASFGPRIWREQRAIFHYHIWKVVARKKNSPLFLFHLLDKITNEMKAGLKNGLGIFHITKSGIENWVVLFPPSLPEQTRIAAALSSLDDLIAAQGDHIAALQTFKRGLMQGLFPATSAGPSTTPETSE